MVQPTLRLLVPRRPAPMVHSIPRRQTRRRRHAPEEQSPPEPDWAQPTTQPGAALAPPAAAGSGRPRSPAGKTDCHGRAWPRSMTRAVSLVELAQAEDTCLVKRTVLGAAPLVGVAAHGGGRCGTGDIGSSRKLDRGGHGARGTSTPCSSRWTGIHRGWNDGVRLVITATAEVPTSEGDGGWLPWSHTAGRHRWGY